MKTYNFRLSKRHKSLLTVSLLLLGISGVAWLIADFYGSDFTNYLSYEVKSYSMKIHGAVAMLFLILVGTLIRDHVLAGISLKKNQKSGLPLIIICLILIITGYLLYYLGDEVWRNYTSIIHSVLGLIFIFVFFFHSKVFSYKKKRK